jgi:hypothetical protein
MKGLLRRALCAAAGALAYAGAAQAAAPAALPFSSDLPAAGAVDFANAAVLSAVTYGPPPARHLATTDVSSSIALMSGLTLDIGSKVDLAGTVTPIAAADEHDAGAFLLTAAPASGGYTALTTGGTAFGISAALSDGLHVNLSVASLAPGISNYAPGMQDVFARIGGDAVPYERRGAQSLAAGLSWDLSNWVELGLNGSQTSETDSILGEAAPGVNAATTSVGVAAKLRLGNGWVTTASYSEGISQLDVKPGAKPGAALAFDTLHSRAYGIAIAKNGLFGDDALGLAVSRPAFSGVGNEFVTLPGATAWPAFVARTAHPESAVPETDVEIGYITTFLDGSVALQTNAAFQMNYAGQYGANAVSLLSRARIKF